MSEAQPAIRRVLVAIEVGTLVHHPRGLLDAAANLAGGSAAELLCLFVEDEDLHRLAALPVSRFVGYPSAAPRDVDAAAMALALRAAAERAAGAVRAAAERRNVRYSFRVARGQVPAAVIAASSEADLVLLARGAHPAAWTGLAATNARAVAERAGRPVVLVVEGKAVGAPAVVYDGSPGGERALAAAALLARATGDRVVVLGAGETPGEAERAARAASDWLSARGLATLTRIVPAPTTGSVIRALIASGAGTLVVDGWPRDAAEMDRLLDEVPLPVMIAR